MEAFANYDVGCVQISTNFKKNFKGQTCNDATLCLETAKNANKILGTTMAKIEYENY